MSTYPNSFVQKTGSTFLSCVHMKGMIYTPAPMSTFSSIGPVEIYQHSKKIAGESSDESLALYTAQERPCMPSLQVKSWLSFLGT